MSDESVTLADNGSMPLLGFGTWQMYGREAYDAVRVALEVGYRHIDTATLYRNEAEIGRALRDSGVGREDVFLTTKLHPSDVGREGEVLRASLAALGTDYLDLWLIHWPPRGRSSVATWRHLADAHAKQSARAIGVSNYSTAQIDELVDATGVTPAVNQIRWSPELYDRRLVEQLRARGVVLEGYSPFRASDLRDPVLADVASAHGVTAAQVVLRWHIEHGFVVIPKSVRRDRILTNFDVFGFSLTAAELARIDALGRR
jgi:2,5-diketo-D-gluconate reductase A